MKELVLLSGPSCVGKGPLYEAVCAFYPDVMAHYSKLVLYNSRQPRPGERDSVDYHFRRRDEIEQLGKQKQFVVMDVRGDLQAVDIQGLLKTLETNAVFFEGNPFFGVKILDICRENNVPVRSVFISPLSAQELAYLHDPDKHVNLENFVTDVMRRKLLRRTQKQKGILSAKDLANIEVRAGSAFHEMQQAWRFDHVLICHDGEDSEHWNAFYYPIGDARKTMMSFAAILAGQAVECEHWSRDLLG